MRGSIWWQRELARVEREMEHVSTRHLRAVEEELRQARALILRELLAARGQWSKGRLQAVLSRTDAALQEVERRLSRALSDALGQAAESGVARVDRVADRFALNARPPNQLLPTRLFLDLWADFTLDLVRRGITEPVKVEIRNTIRAGFLTGRSLFETMEEIASADFERLTFSSRFHRAEAIVRTETNRVANRAAYLRVLDYQRVAPQGEVWRKRWGTAQDERVRDTHAEAGQQPPIPVEADFIVGGHPCKHPVDPNLPAEESVNCRCSLLAVPPGLEVIPQVPGR